MHASSFARFSEHMMHDLTKHFLFLKVGSVADVIANDLGERTTPCMVGYDGEEVVRALRSKNYDQYRDVFCRRY